MPGVTKEFQLKLNWTFSCTSTDSCGLIPDVLGSFRVFGPVLL